MITALFIGLFVIIALGGIAMCAAVSTLNPHSTGFIPPAPQEGHDAKTD